MMKMKMMIKVMVVELTVVVVRAQGSKSKVNKLYPSTSHNTSIIRGAHLSRRVVFVADLILNLMKSP